MEKKPILSQELLNFLFQLIFGTIIVFLFFTQLERFLTMIFVLNFSTAGPNVTILLVLFLLTGLVEVILPYPHSMRTLSVCILGATIMVVLSFIPVTLIATLAAIFAMIFITPVLVNRIQLEKEQFSLSIILGVVLQIILRSWLGTASYYATIIGTILFLFWISLGILLWFFNIRYDPRLIESSQSTFTGVPPVIGFLFIQILFLGFPNVVSTWFFRNYILISFTGIFGLVLGGLLTFEKGGHLTQNKLEFGWVILFLFSLIDLLWINLMPFITYFTVQVSICVILYMGLSKNSIRSPRVVGLRMTVFQFLMVFILILHVSAGNWAFMPSILAFTRGHAATTIFVAGLLLPLASLRFEIPLNFKKKPQQVLNSVRIIFLSAIIISMLGVVTNDLLKVQKSPDTSKLKVMTFNIHQYFSIGQTGLYNLEQVRDVILESGADVVGLQESEGARITSSSMNGVQWLAHQTGMNYYYYGPPTSAQIYGVSLLSRFPILSAYYEDLPAYQSIERVAIVVEIDTGEIAGELPIVVTHFQTGKYTIDRYNQAVKILDITEDFTNSIILGDFNTRPDVTDQAFVLLNSTFSDTWILSGNTSDSGTSYNNSGFAVKRIDYVWLKGSWTVLNCAIFGSPRVSDHRAVYTELVLG
ncbi:MAG: endonuclease/exonuclease/phosphatase family protein [Candidatus Heimdallarchaeota archaeon]|nr:MAG: endonuclease/exonuclease/phosphatase family protein [Candidatus Heimdallarchaeota archaeon]